MGAPGCFLLSFGDGVTIAAARNGSLLAYQIQGCADDVPSGAGPENETPGNREGGELDREGVTLWGELGDYVVTDRRENRKRLHVPTIAKRLAKASRKRRLGFYPVAVSPVTASGVALTGYRPGFYRPLPLSNPTPVTPGHRHNLPGGEAGAGVRRFREPTGFPPSPGESQPCGTFARHPKAHWRQSDRDRRKGCSPAEASRGGS